MQPTFSCALKGILLLSAVLIQSCSKRDKINQPPVGPVSMQADFQSSFERARVQYFIDDWQVFDQSLTTQHHIGLAHTHESGLQPGLHKFRVVVDGRHAKDTTIDLQRNLYLGVNYNAGDMRFLLSEVRWMYE